MRTRRRFGLPALALALVLLAACFGGDEPPQQGESAGPELPFRGVFLREGGVLRFTECTTGITYPLADGPGLDSLEAAYEGVRATSDDPVLVSFLARIESRPGSDSVARDHLVVRRFDAVHINGICEAVVQSPPLERTTWRAHSLQGTAVPADDPPTLTLDPETGLVGWTGCRPVTGVYTLTGSELRFGALNRPEVPCPGDLRVEQLYLGALQVAGSFEMSADTLRLVGESGVVGVFTAG